MVSFGATLAIKSGVLAFSFDTFASGVSVSFLTESGMVFDLSGVSGFDSYLIGVLL